MEKVVVVDVKIVAKTVVIKNNTKLNNKAVANCKIFIATVLFFVYINFIIIKELFFYNMCMNSCKMIFMKMVTSYSINMVMTCSV